LQNLHLYGSVAPGTPGVDLAQSRDVLARPSELTERVIGCAIKVHRTLGPGLLESAYELCLAHELTQNEIPFERQVPVPVMYQGLAIDCAYRADVIVNRALLLEIKSVEKVGAIHHAQVLTYLKLLGLQQGLLMNFNSTTLVNGLKSFLL
jgi:GxxExxY protein